MHVHREPVFAADDGSHGQEPWITNGTYAQMIADIQSPGSSAPWGGAEFSGFLFFTAQTAAHGAELWMSCRTHREGPKGEPGHLPPPADRFEDSVDLVLYAFERGGQGDIFVQKAPASTIQVLAQALKEIFNSDSEIRVIGTRHGEKLYESLVAREELAKAEDMGDYYRIPADNRDLNYAKFVVEGETEIANLEDYTSHNTTRLDVEGTKRLLLKLDFIQEQLRA